MNVRTPILLFVFVLAVQCHFSGLREHFRQKEHESLLNSLSDQTLGEAVKGFFDQEVDHFDPTNDATFRQLYYINAAHYVAGGPIFLLINGEGPLHNTSAVRGFEVELAKEMHGVVAILEHRFYGVSHPFQDLTVESLRYLNSRQALSDLAEFRQFIAEKYRKDDPDIDKRFIVIGGSYAGAMSSWFRLKFPHLVVGSLASSAPVEAEEAFYQYDEIVAHSAGPECAGRIREAFYHVERMLADPWRSAWIKHYFGGNAEEVEDDTSFLYVLTDAVAYAIQYGHREDLCSRMTRAESHVDIIAALANFTKWLWPYLHTTAPTFDLGYYDSILLDPASSSRQWMWQSCTEFGYFQVAPSRNSLRPARIDLEYHYGICRKLFGQDFVPDVKWINENFGGQNHTQVTNTIFTNGDQDPWQYLSVGRNLTDSTVAIMIKGSAHCGDLHQPSEHDSKYLKNARSEIRTLLAKWFNEAG